MAEEIFQIGIKALIRDEQGQILLLRCPAWADNPAYWDMPGGRVEPGESFLQTLQRELHEEIGVNYQDQAKQLMAFITNAVIPVGSKKVPLAFVVYEVALPSGARITLDPNSREEAFEWFAPGEAAEKLSAKCPPEFCELVARL